MSRTQKISAARLSAILTATVGPMAFASGPSHANVFPLGPAFQVNTYTSDFQGYTTSVAADGAGRFVVSWNSYGQDGSSTATVAQQFDGAGLPAGSEFVANTFTANFQRGQRTKTAASSQRDGFVLVWESYVQDGWGSAVAARRFAPDGAPRGGDFLVNTYTTSDQSYPAVGSSVDGSFVIVWQSAQDGDGTGIFGQRFDSDGAPLEPEFRVNSYTTGSQYRPDLAVRADGSFVVTWHGIGPNDPSGNGVVARRFATDGSPLAPDFQVNTYTTGDQARAFVSALDSGEFLIAWESYGQDGDSAGIFAQRFDGVGVTQGSEFRVNSDPAGAQADVAIAHDSDGSFMVTWWDGNTLDVRGQAFDSEGAPAGHTFDASSSEFGFNPAVTANAAGTFVVAWETYNENTNSSDVFARLFCNGANSTRSCCGSFVNKWGSYGAGDDQFELPLGIATDSAGNVYVADQDNYAIRKFDGDGNFITRWGGFGTGNGQFDFTGPSVVRNIPIGIAVDADDNVYVPDRFNDRVQVFTSSGVFIRKWGSTGSGAGQFSEPSGIDVDSDGFVYVTDANNHRVQKFDADGEYVTEWGSFGTSPGQLDVPDGIAVDGQSSVYVADRENHRIQKFDSDGSFLATWGSQGAGDGEFRSPSGVAVDAEDNVYVADRFNNRIQKFDSTGRFVTVWGAQAQNAGGDGALHTPLDVAVDDSGNVFVPDYATYVVQKFVCPAAFCGDGQLAAGEACDDGDDVDGDGCDADCTFTEPPTTSTTTTSTTSTSATSSTTSTTVTDPPSCGQPVSSGILPVATDCLYILRAAVALQTCAPACICDTTGNGQTSASDALLCLKVAVGEPETLMCLC